MKKHMRVQEFSLDKEFYWAKSWVFKREMKITKIIKSKEELEGLWKRIKEVYSKGRKLKGKKYREI